MYQKYIQMHLLLKNVLTKSRTTTTIALTKSLNIKLYGPSVKSVYTLCIISPIYAIFSMESFKSAIMSQIRFLFTIFFVFVSAAFFIMEHVVCLENCRYLADLKAYVICDISTFSMKIVFINDA